MNRLLLFVIIMIFFAWGLEAAVYKGQKIFIKKCASCHNNKLEFISKKTTIEWEELMESRGMPLVMLHQKVDKNNDLLEYFSSKSFKKKNSHLLDFFTEYAKDSGNVPACY